MPYALTLFYAALLGLVLLALSVNVVRLRRQHKVGVGAGEHRDLELAVRAHGNFCEYVPFALLLLFILEATTAVPAIVLHLLGAGLLIGRILHGFFGLNRSHGATPGRFVGTLLTWLMILLAALFGLGLALGHWLGLAVSAG